MNTKLGQLVSTLIIIGLALFWSASILAEEPAGIELTSDAAAVSVVIAADATEEAAAEAARSIAAETKIELEPVTLEILVADQKSARVSGD